MTKFQGIIFREGGRERKEGSDREGKKEAPPTDERRATRAHLFFALRPSTKSAIVLLSHSLSVIEQVRGEGREEWNVPCLFNPSFYARLA